MEGFLSTPLEGGAPGTAEPGGLGDCDLPALTCEAITIPVLEVFLE